MHGSNGALQSSTCLYCFFCGLDVSNIDYIRLACVY
jgi:hypothetical protein